MKEILHDQQVQIVQKLGKTSYPKEQPNKWIRIKQCCKETKAEMTCKNPDCKHHIDIYYHRCRLAICPLCQAVESQKRYNDAMKVLKYYQWKYGGDIFFLTWTIKTGDDLKKQIKKLQRALSQLKKNKYWRELCIGGYQSIEVTRSNRKWHVHCHMIILSRIPYPLDLERLKTTWKRITGDSKVMHAKWIQSDSLHDIKDTFKYCLKMDKDMSSKKHIYEFSTVADHVRFFSKIGVFHGEEEIVKKTFDSHYSNVSKQLYEKHSNDNICPKCRHKAKWNVKDSCNIPFEEWEKKAKGKTRLYRKGSDYSDTVTTTKDVYDLLLPRETVTSSIAHDTFLEHAEKYYENPNYKPRNL